MDFISTSWLFWFLLAQICVRAGGQLVMPARLSGVRGKGVNFTALVPPATEVQTVSWTFVHEGDVKSVPVYVATTQNEKVSDPYKGRVTYHRSTYTLEFSSLNPTDSGVYSLTIVDSNLDQLVGQTILVVLEPVADVTITSNLPEAVEFNSTVILTCVAKGSNLSYNWLNNSSPVVVDGKHIVQDGSQLIINEVFRKDLLGPITCTAKNQLESSTSDGFNLTVYYGPELLTKTQDPAADVLKKGSNMTLSCSATSSPAATFSWIFNGEPLPQQTSTIVLSSLGEEHNGNYSCIAFNSKTKLYVTSDITKLSVIEAISGTVIRASTEHLIAGNSTVNLTCTSTVGKADSAHWHKDGKPLEGTSRITFNTDKSTLTILTVQKEDAGEYKCQLKNKINSEEKNFKMIVNYGPENMAIKGEKRAMVGQSVRINCTFSSFPVPTFVWKFNDSVLVGETNECLTIQSFDYKDSGIYTCEALNPITGLKSSTTHNLMVKDSEQQDSNGLSGGAIAGIVIAVLVVFAIIIGVCIQKRRKVSDIPSPY